MIPVRQTVAQISVPWVTWSLVMLNIVIFLWDRTWSVNHPPVVFSDLALVPKDVTDSFTTHGDRLAYVTLFTSMFLHGNWLHLLGNLLFLLVFGGSVEDALKPWRFATYYLFWGVAAGLVMVLVDPRSTIPTLGASGAIGGVLGCYFLLYPSSRVHVIVPPFILFPLPLRAWVLLGLWILWQVFIPQPGVAAWAHVGGFLAGMLTVLVMGGRAAALRQNLSSANHGLDA